MTQRLRQAFDSVEPRLRRAVVRLYWYRQRQRWRTILLLWLVLVPLCLWGLREMLGLLTDYFTWSAIRYGLAYHPLPAIGLLSTMILTTTRSLAMAWSRLIGPSQRQVRQMEAIAQQIQNQGKTHPLLAAALG